MTRPQRIKPCGFGRSATPRGRSRSSSQRCRARHQARSQTCACCPARSAIRISTTTRLQRSFGEHGIRYEHFRELGGRRKPRADSTNIAWRNDAFRGYADHMETPEFGAASRGCSRGPGKIGPAAIMCAEAVWWRCHRGLVSDYLKARGIEVLHIVDAKKADPHPWTSAATIVDGRLSYAGDDPVRRTLPLSGGLSSFALAADCR